MTMTYDLLLFLAPAPGSCSRLVLLPDACVWGSGGLSREGLVSNDQAPFLEGGLAVVIRLCYISSVSDMRFLRFAWEVPQGWAVGCSRSRPLSHFLVVVVAGWVFCVGSVAHMGGGVIEFATPIASPRNRSCGVGVSRGRCRTHGRWGARVRDPYRTSS